MINEIVSAVSDALYSYILIILIVIFILYALKALKDYEKQSKEGKESVFHAKDIDLPDKVDYLN